MGYIDAQLTFSDAQALTVTAASTNVIDTVVDGNLGIGEPMVAVITLDVLATATNTDETYVIALQTDTVENFASPTALGSVTITRGAAAGSRYLLPVPMDTTGQRYFRLYATLGGTSPTVTVTAHLTRADMLDNSVNYANNYTIS